MKVNHKGYSIFSNLLILELLKRLWESVIWSDVKINYSNYGKNTWNGECFG